MVKRVNSIILILTLLLLISCSKPNSFYQFREKTLDYRDSGVVACASFEYPIYDTTESHSLYMVLKYNALELKLDTLKCVIHQTIDDTVSYNNDTLLVSLGSASKAKRSGSVVDIEWQIYNNFRFDTVGVWRTTIEIDNPEAVQAIRGVGYSYRKE